MSRSARTIRAALLMALAALAPAGLAAQKLPPLETVPVLDANRYVGRWYEIARFQHSFEKTLVGATAEYALRDDGRISVLNSGFKRTLDGRYTKANAVAWVPDPARPGALKVKFFGLFTSDYLVMGLGEDYDWAVVGNDDREYLWFLARTPTIAPELLERMKAIALAQGYDLSGLYLVPQKER
ncbi:MAG TPA: lipocalin family protein [Spirochaetales bacterium]|nr:lipocalin family protein [Spirochaetales bacterium]